MLAERNLLRIPRQPDLLVGFTVQPIMFVLLFVYVFGGAIQTPGYDYVDFLIPGIIVQTMAFGGFVTALGLAEDLKKGLIDRFRSLPMARAAVLAGRTLADVGTNALSTRGHDRRRAARRASRSRRELGEIVARHRAAAAVRLRVLVGLRAHRADRVRRPRPRTRSASSLIFPLTFISSAFVPVDSMPDWLQCVRRAQPVHDVVDATRVLFLDAHADNAVWLSFVWVVVITLVFGMLSVWRFRRALSR